MRVGRYLKEKSSYLISMVLLLLVLEFYFSVLNVGSFLMIFTPVFVFLSFCIPMMMEYMKKSGFYKEFERNMEQLDHKYLIHELMEAPSFEEGSIVYEGIRTMSQEMMEEIDVYKQNIKEYKEYIELWVHEIKTPVTNAKLLIENNRTPVLTSIEEELEQMESYIEQTLYYSKIDMVEEDYRIQPHSLKTIVYDAVKANKKSLIGNHFSMNLHDLDCTVYTDSKWMVFVLNQLFINAIKYKKEGSASLECYAVEKKEEVILYITDSGIGIKLEELGKVMEKGFVGSNGRKKEATTGMGLYICKKLLVKMHHGLRISSTEGEGTTVMIHFPKSSYYV